MTHNEVAATGLLDRAPAATPVWSRNHVMIRVSIVAGAYPIPGRGFAVLPGPTDHRVRHALRDRVNGEVRIGTRDPIAVRVSCSAIFGNPEAPDEFREPLLVRCDESEVIIPEGAEVWCDIPAFGDE